MNITNKIKFSMRQYFCRSNLKQKGKFKSFYSKLNHDITFSYSCSFFFRKLVFNFLLITLQYNLLAIFIFSTDTISWRKITFTSTNAILPAIEERNFFFTVLSIPTTVFDEGRAEWH